MKAVWIALIAVGVSLLTTFVALYAARIKAREGNEDVYGTDGDLSAASDRASDGGGGGCD